MIRATLDVGNSTIGLVPWRRGAPGTVERLATLAAAAERLARLGPQACAAISVAPGRLEDLLRLLGDGADRVLVLRNAPPGLGVPDLLASAGADRVANVLGVGTGPAVAVDAGTAVTVDLVDGEGSYLGGFIAPGPAAAAAGVSAATACLPVVPGRPAPLHPGTATRDALASGVWGLTVGGLDRLVDEARRVLGGRGVPIVATGGWGEAWMRDSRLDGIRWQPDLVHHGIARWAGWS